MFLYRMKYIEKEMAKRKGIAEEKKKVEEK